MLIDLVGLLTLAIGLFRKGHTWNRPIIIIYTTATTILIIIIIIMTGIASDDNKVMIITQ